MFLILALGLSLVNSFLVRDSLTFLASDQLEGRRSGDPGNEKASTFLEQKLKDLEISPLSTEYRQEFTIFKAMAKQGNNFLKVEGEKVLFEPLSHSTTGIIDTKELVFVGFGISAPNDPDLDYDDYQGLDVSGKVVVLFTGDPGIGNIHSPFRHPQYAHFRSLAYKLKNAERLGAKGVLVISDPITLQNNDDTPRFDGRDGGGERFQLLAGKVTNKWFEEISGKRTLDLQSEIAQNTRPCSFSIPISLNLSVQLRRETARVANIVGLIEGTDAVKKDEFIVLGAHYDHLGHGGETSLDPSPIPIIHNGADDNASGTAAVLGIAEAIRKNPLERSVVVVFFNAEELGLLGSKHFMTSWDREKKIQAMINFDMVGRYKEKLLIMGMGSSLDWPSIIPSSQLINIEQVESALASSDHANFLIEKIPSLFFTTGPHEDYHRSTDDTDKIQWNPLTEITNIGLQLTKKLANRDAISFNPDFPLDQSSGRDRGYGSHFGCIPEFVPSTNAGVKCEGIVPDSPAMTAGVLPGDILLQLGEISLNSLYDLAFALRYYRPGDRLKIYWSRGNQQLDHDVTLSAKKEKHRDHFHQEL